jgi:uncharacterized protein (DUF1330 family)
LTALFIGELEVNEEHRQDFDSVFLAQAYKELEDAGAKLIAGGFDKTVSLFGIPPKNRYVVIQFESMNALEKWWQLTPVLHRPVEPAPENGPEAGRRRRVEVGRTPVIQAPKLGSFEFHAPKGGPKISRRSPKRNVRKQMQTEGVMTSRAKSSICASVLVKSPMPERHLMITHNIEEQ